MSCGLIHVDIDLERVVRTFAREIVASPQSALIVNRIITAGENAGTLARQEANMLLLTAMNRFNAHNSALIDNFLNRADQSLQDKLDQLLTALHDEAEELQRAAEKALDRAKVEARRVTCYFLIIYIMVGIIQAMLISITIAIIQGSIRVDQLIDQLLTIPLLWFAGNLSMLFQLQIPVWLIVLSFNSHWLATWGLDALTRWKMARNNRQLALARSIIETESSIHRLQERADHADRAIQALEASINQLSVRIDEVQRSLNTRINNIINGQETVEELRLRRIRFLHGNNTRWLFHCESEHVMVLRATYGDAGDHRAAWHRNICQDWK